MTSDPRPRMPQQQPTPSATRGAGSQALIPFSSSADSVLPALTTPDLSPALLARDLTPEEICIIPGSGVPEAPPFAPPPRRTYRVQTFVAAVVLCGMLAALFTFAPLTQAAGHNMSPLSALANLILMPTPRVYFDYHVLPGDTFERIATHFGVSVGGIYELNQIYAGQEVQTGQILHIPSNPQFGVNYQPPMVPMISAGAGIGVNNYYGSCLFCSAGGWTNGAHEPCAAASTQIPVTPWHFALLAPEAGSHWVRGFTWDHNGIDMSSGQFDTPITAAQAGVVIFAGWDPYGGGFAVKINHCGGLATAYAHMEKLLVTLGQAVQPGQAVGLQGATGNATGPHVHFMAWWDNVPFDPLCVYYSLDGMTTTTHYGGCPAPQTAP